MSSKLRTAVAAHPRTELVAVADLDTEAARTACLRGKVNRHAYQ
jgi:hypothetical protein